MEVEYYEYDWSRKRRLTSEDVEFWISCNLRDGLIEERISKISKTLAIIGEKFLAENPGCVSQIAEAIGCDGENYSIKQHTS